MEKKYKVVSLFSGCGGLDLGFKGGFKYRNKTYSKHPFELIWANDIDAPSCLTYERNFGHPSVVGDIREILVNPNSSLPQEADVVLGGFPCQDFSLAGKRRGFSSPRGLLYKAMVETIKRLRPHIFVAENVKGLLSMDKGKALESIKKEMEELGYTLSTKLYHSADYEVPQSRERVIIVGVDKLRSYKAFTHPDPVTPTSKSRITLGDVLSDLESLPEGALANHFWSKARRYPGTQGNNNVNRDAIGPTMRAEHHGNIEFHWNGNRRLSAREAARIQTFPDDFIFYPSTSQAYKQIGNAVPPVMGWHIAKSIATYLNNNVK